MTNNQCCRLHFCSDTEKIGNWRRQGDAEGCEWTRAEDPRANGPYQAACFHNRFPEIHFLYRDRA